MAHLYGAAGPSAWEQTLEYAPPEAIFRSYWQGSRTVRLEKQISKLHLHADISLYDVDIVGCFV